MEDLFGDVFEKKDQQIYRYFNGKTWNTSTSGKTLPIIRPHDQTTLGMVQAVTTAEVDMVIAKAKSAQFAWEQKSLHERIEIVKRAADLMRQHESTMTDILIQEIGKSRQESKSEILRTADLIEYCATEVQSLRGYSVESDAFPGYEKGKTSLIEHVAHGIILAIGPFNYPVNLVASKIAPGLLMGNAVVVKPPTQGSISGLLLTQIFVKAGVPEGIISCVTGEGREIGDYLVSHPDISMIAFTGSTGVGQALSKKAGMKSLLLECGGNNPVIVLPDANLPITAKEIVKGGFAYSGQRCTGIKYVLGNKEILDALIPMIVEQMQAMIQMGDPNEEKTKLVGPVISVKAAEEIESIINEAVSQGAEIIVGGKRNNGYVEPTLLKNVKKEMKVVKEETFGPVVSFITVESIDEAIAIVGESTFGLQASIFTQDEGTGMNLAKRINTGTVQLNGSPQRGPDHFPFMGVKASGIGVQGVRYSLEAMSRLKSVVINNPS